MPALVRGLKRQGGGPRHLLEALEDRAVIAYLTERQNRAGHFLGVFPSTVLGAACLHALGVPAEDPRLRRAVQSFAPWKIRTSDGLHVVPFNSEPWDTAYIVRTLVESGLPREHAAVRRAVSYLLGEQCLRPAPEDLQNPQPGTPRVGGWAFEEGNELGPDADTTAVVVAALKVAGIDPAVPAAIARGVAWMRGMQNPDGGWPSFAWGHRSKKPGPTPLKAWQLDPGPKDLLTTLMEPPLGFDDPACEELTGRVLIALGLCGYTRDNPEVRRAIAFLKAQRTQDGVWWGRWTPNFLAATADVVLGLVAVGEDLEAPYVQQALSWLLSRQNADGGFGETIETYARPELAGTGPSTPGLTALVLCALMEAGERGSKAVERGIRFLLSRQQEDGLWDDAPYVKAVHPPVVYYREPVFAHYGPLKALVLYSS
jgi:squalene-hopene/tetraprenyl-beta-curcumene cyclase